MSIEELIAFAHGCAFVSGATVVSAIALIPLAMMALLALWVFIQIVKPLVALVDVSVSLVRRVVSRGQQ